MDLKANEVLKLQKFVLLEALEEVLSEDTIINYTGLYSLEDKKRVFKMIDDGMEQSDDIGIMLFYNK